MNLQKLLPKRLLTRLANYIVQPAPPDISECIDCRECNCTVEARRNCKRRIAEQEAIEKLSNYSTE